MMSLEKRRLKGDHEDDDNDSICELSVATAASDEIGATTAHIQDQECEDGYKQAVAVCDKDPDAVKGYLRFNKRLITEDGKVYDEQYPAKLPWINCFTCAPPEAVKTANYFPLQVTNPPPEDTPGMWAGELFDYYIRGPNAKRYISRADPLSGSSTSVFDDSTVGCCNNTYPPSSRGEDECAKDYQVKPMAVCQQMAAQCFERCEAANATVSGSGCSGGAKFCRAHNVVEWKEKLRTSFSDKDIMATYVNNEFYCHSRDGIYYSAIFANSSRSYTLGQSKCCFFSGNNEILFTSSSEAGSPTTAAAATPPGTSPSSHANDDDAKGHAPAHGSGSINRASSSSCLHLLVTLLMFICSFDRSHIVLPSLAH